LTCIAPNRDGFTPQHGFMRIDGKPDTHATACMSNCVADIRLASEIPEYARDSHGNLAQQTRRLGPAGNPQGSVASVPARAAPAPGAAFPCLRDRRSAIGEADLRAIIRWILGGAGS